MTAVGFIGFGEVAACFSVALARHGCTVTAYDILLCQPGGADVLQRRAGACDIRFRPLRELLASSELVMSTVVSAAALDVASACLPHLKRDQIFLDLNATSPAIKREIAATLKTCGRTFVEGAILSAVGVSGANSRILMCGEKADFVASTLSKHGLNAEYYGVEIGRASTFKLLRSIFSKGVEALLLETRLAARQTGLDGEVWREIVDTVDRHDFAEVGGNWMRSHGTAHDRRYHEMMQVEALVRDLGIDPIMTKATTAFFERSTRLHLSQRLGSPPRNPEDVLDGLRKMLRDVKQNGRSSETA